MIYLEDRVIRAAQLREMAKRAIRMEVTRRGDNAGCDVAFILDDTAAPEQYLGYVGNTAHAENGVWLYYTSDVAAYLKSCNPEAEVNAWTHYGALVIYDEAMAQFA